MSRFLFSISTAIFARLVKNSAVTPVYEKPNDTNHSHPSHINMCVEVTYKYVCGCLVSPKGAPHKEWCAKAAKTNRECWGATDQRDELWHGTEVCPVHKGKGSRIQPKNPGAAK